MRYALLLLCVSCSYEWQEHARELEPEERAEVELVAEEWTLGWSRSCNDAFDDVLLVQLEGDMLASACRQAGVGACLRDSKYIVVMLGLSVDDFAWTLRHESIHLASACSNTYQRFPHGWDGDPYHMLPGIWEIQDGQDSFEWRLRP